MAVLLQIIIIMTLNSLSVFMLGPLFPIIAVIELIIKLIS